MGAKRILIADDEEKIRQVVAVYLEKEGFETGEAASGKAALEMAKKENWDLIILDVMMPEMDGVAVCQEIRKNSRVPIIMLTAKNDEIDRILGLEMGADDYMGKPFSPRELTARIKAVLRRYPSGEEGEAHLLVYNHLRINPLTREVTFQGQPVSLTLKEYDLLALMAKNPGRTFTREQLLEQVWGYDYFGDNRTVDTHINRLRDKLRDLGTPNYVQTVWGVGYKFEANP